MADAGRGGGDLPSGTLTFLFTDIEGSTRAVQALGDRYPAILVEHRTLLEAAIAAHGGRVFGYDGDAVFSVFERAEPALAAAADAQRGLASHAWPADVPIRVRMGIHTGPVERLGDDYVGLTLHQVARIAATGIGGQVVVSATARALASDRLPPDLELHDLGEHRLKDLAHPERLYELRGPGLASSGQLRTLDARPNNLPVQVTTFVGREELELGRRLLASSRLVTLTGPGGTGKTRLALQLAAEALDDHRDGVFFVGLDATTDPDLIPSEILSALGMDPGSRPPLDHLVGLLPGRDLLLVLDNLEQIIDGAPIIGRLLAAAPELRVLATSRIPLRIAGEQEFPVPPLRLPDAGDVPLDAETAVRSEAVRLFVERAMAAEPSFRLTDDGARDVVEIVRRLDGLPLAIELAAARVRTLPLPSLRSRLDQRLSLLVGGPRDRPSRQQTLRGAIDWSHDLLDDVGRRAFRRVGVFADAFELTEAEVVLGPPSELGVDVLDALESLSDQSLIRPAPAGDSPRFAMLVTVREYAAERLTESEEEGSIRDRHAAAYLALAERVSGDLMGFGGPPLLDLLERSHDDLRMAIDHAVTTGDTDTALRFLAALWRFWQIRGHLVEADGRAERILGMPGVDGADPGVIARALGARGGIAYWRGDFPSVSQAYGRALEAARRSGDPKTLADALYDAGFTAFADEMTPTSMYAHARPYLEEAARLYQKLGDERGLANVEWGLGTGAAYVQENDEALDHLSRALAAYRATGDRFGEGWALHMSGFVKGQAGDPLEADRLFREAFEVFAPAGDISAMTIILVDLATAAGRLGDGIRAARLGGAATAIRHTSGSDLLAMSGAIIGWPVPEPPPEEDELGSAAWAQGAADSLEDVIAVARQPIAVPADGA